MSDLDKAAREFGLERAALDFERQIKTATHVKQAVRGEIDIPRPLISDFEKFHQALHKVAEMVRQLSPQVNKAWGDAEDAVDFGQKAFVAKGNHPDDYNSTPEGERVESTMHFLQDIAQLLDPQDSRGVGKRIVDADDEVEGYLKSMKAGRW